MQPDFLSKAEVANAVGNSIGFKLKNCQYADAGDIGCQLIYASSFLYSQLYHLKVYGECGQIIHQSFKSRYALCSIHVPI